MLQKAVTKQKAAPLLPKVKAMLPHRLKAKLSRQKVTLLHRLKAKPSRQKAKPLLRLKVKPRLSSSQFDEKRKGRLRHLVRSWPFSRA